MHDVTSEFDICYATEGDAQLLLDLYRPRMEGVVPVVLYLHGGGWARGDKRDHGRERLEALASHGIAVASVNYRLAPAHIYPAQLHDVKAAVRWLRASGAGRGLDADRLAIWGASAGGYLATMAGLTNGDPDLEGAVGDHGDVSSAVQAVVSWFSLFDFRNTIRRSALEARIVPPPLAPTLFGVDVLDERDPRLASANPARRIHDQAPPFLIMHGDNDHVVPASESLNLHSALSREGVDTTLCLLGGLGHEDARFDSAANLAMLSAWLHDKLKAI